jgi:hypothetical protein
LLNCRHASKIADYGIDSTIPVKGETLSYGKWLRKAINSLNYVMARDPSKLWRNDEKTALSFWRVLQFVESPTALLSLQGLARLTCELLWSMWVGLEGECD